MKPSTLARHFREGMKNIVRNGWMTIASIISVSITLLILGSVFILAFNINHMADRLENQVEISAFVELTAGQPELEEIERQLKAIPELESFRYVPKEVGAVEFIEGLGEQGHHFQEFAEPGNNPLPDKYMIHAKEPRETALVAQKVAQIKNIYKVNDGGETTQNLFTVTSWIRNIGLIFIIGLAFTAMLLIANTIKITITARRREIEIMKLVGATNGFIRWPFFIEGLLLGLIGSAIPIALLILSYQQMLRGIGNLSEKLHIELFELLPLYPLAYQLALLLVSIGAFIGIWGSLISVRKFLRV